MPEETTFIYDNVLYPNYLHWQMHPDKLAVMAKFYGLDPKPVENCRVLELGCGTGSSLLSFAFDLPGSEFVGVDLSKKQIEIGQSAVEAANLQNLSFRQADIMEISREEYGEFDYITAHGVYSWVPAIVRDKVLKICREMLAPQGVAYISYNTLPGCHYRQILREMTLYHTKNVSSPIEKVKQSLPFLKFIADAAPSHKIYKTILQEEFEKLSRRSVETIIHDDFSEFNHSLYFYEFIKHAREHDLQFLTNSGNFSTQNGKYNTDVIEILQKISSDVIAFEQYLDFIDGRFFRSTLLCHKEIKLNGFPDSKVLNEIRISSPLQPVSAKPELATAKPETFSRTEDEKIEINHPLTKAALFHLGQMQEKSTTFQELVKASRKLLADETGTNVEINEQQIEILARIFLKIFAPEFLRFQTHRHVFAAEAGENPLASPVARWQSQYSDTVTALDLSEFVFRDELGKEFLKLLDGTRDRPRLIADLTEFVNSDRYDQPASVKENIIENLPAQLESSLAFFAENALLVS